ncbi:protein kinase [Streptomyces sp. NPDC007916]
MGRVWLAHDEELACEVAVKEIAVPQEIPEQDLNARIARARGKARHSALLRGNPHVVTVYDCVVDDGLPWIVMEYVPGARDLEAVIRESGPLSPTDTARLGVALLDALMAVHRLDILRRDVKPSNILLTNPEPQVPNSAQLGRILLSDYGISLQRDVGEARLTTASGIVGTPGYLAPERARRRADTGIRPVLPRRHALLRRRRTQSLRPQLLRGHAHRTAHRRAHTALPCRRPGSRAIDAPCQGPRAPSPS